MDVGALRQVDGHRTARISETHKNLMGHEDVKTTLNVYRHLIEKAESSTEERIGMIQRLDGNSCSNSVAKLPSSFSLIH